ncbi:MAG: hypothetical protein HY275_02855 [Gemmatimonadetes bacterium]|nr:hypothetical protein [Gemmatimonadota bacterium]
MQYEISDVAAIEFSRALYEAIASGLPIDAAVGDARKAVSMQGRNTVEWATPVLHMRASNGVLFDLDRAAFRASAMQMEAISEQDVPSPASPTPTPARSRTPAAPVPAASGAKPWWKQTWALVVGVMLATVLGLGIIGMFMDDAPAPSPVAAAPATQAGGSDATPGSQQAVNAAGAQEIALDALSVTGAVVLPCDRIDQVTISSDQQPATLSVVNGSPQLIKVFWVSQPGQRTLYANLESRQRYDQPTYRGHLWILTDASGGCRTAFYATAEHANVTVNDLDRMPH